MKQRPVVGKSPATDRPRTGSADLQRRRWLRAFGAAPLAAGIAAQPAQAAMKTNARIVIAGSGLGGIAVASRLMKQLGGSSQVLAVTHLAQVAACADHHFVVTKALQGAATVSDVQPVAGDERVSEVARMLGGERLSGTSRAHAEAMLGGAHDVPAPKPARSTQKQR